MMHIAGVDVKPLDDLLGEQEALEAQGKQIPKQLNENFHRPPPRVSSR